MAAAKQWGDAQFDRLDKLTVGLPHPDATAAIISGGTEVTAHFATPPFWNQELAGNPKAHKILSSYDVLGGPGSSTLLFATTRFRQEHRKSFDAFLDALQDAARFARAHPDQAADIYIRTSGASTDRDFLASIINAPAIQYQTTPDNPHPLAKFRSHERRVGKACPSTRITRPAPPPSQNTPTHPP